MKTHLDELLLKHQFTRQFKAIFTKFMSFTCYSILWLLPYHVLANDKAIHAYNNFELPTAKEIFSNVLANDKQNSMALRYLAKIASYQDNLDDAEALIEQAIGISPNSAVYQYDAARIYAKKVVDGSIFSISKYVKKAREAYKRAVVLAPESIPYKLALMNFYLRAPAIFGGSKQLALTEVENINKLDNEKGILALANFHSLTEQQAELFKLYDDHLGNSASNIELLLHRGKYYASSEKHKLAHADFVQVISMTNDQLKNKVRYNALFELGAMVAKHSIQSDAAIAALTEYITSAPFDDLLPDKAWAKYYLAVIYQRDGLKEKARNLLTQSQDETYDKKLARKIKKALRKL